MSVQISSILWRNNAKREKVENFKLRSVESKNRTAKWALLQTGKQRKIFFTSKEGCILGSTHTSFGVSYLCHASVIPTVLFYNFLEIACIVVSMSILPRLHPMVGVFKYFLTTKHLLHSKSSTIETNSQKLK